MPEERRLSISSSSQVSPDDVERRTFRAGRRGYDPEEVRSYLEDVARELRMGVEREKDLRRQVADAEKRAANPVFDDETLMSALGQEMTRVLQSARDAAHDVVAKGETQAAQMRSEASEELERAKAESASMRAEAQHEIEETQDRVEALLGERQAQAEASAAEYRRRSQEESAAVIEAAHVEAESLIAQGRAECRDMIEEAQALRSRVLGDLSKRRKVLHAQIEQLRAGREHLAETVRDVRRSIDSIADGLFRAEDEARLAAEVAGREAVARTDDTTPEEMAAALLADEAAAGAAALVGTEDNSGPERDGHGESDDGQDAAAGPDDAGAGDGVEDEPRAAVLVSDEVAADGEAEADLADDIGVDIDIDIDIDSEAEPADDETDEAEDGDSTVTAAGVVIEGATMAGDVVTAEVFVEAANPDETAPDSTGAQTDGDEEETNDEGEPKVAVEALFAKIRAGRSDKADSDSDRESASPSETRGKKTSPRGGSNPSQGKFDGLGTDGQSNEEADEETEDSDPLVARRDDLAAPIIKALARRMKRNLQDDQNELLDRLRSNNSVWSPDILPEDQEHHDAYATAALPHLETAGAAGATYIGGDGAPHPAVDDIIGIAASLAETIVGPLQRRLLDDERLEGADEDVVVEHIGSAFREWKGERIDRLAGDHVVEAFSTGVLVAGAADPELQIEWLAASAGNAQPCPDCEDNALNGPLRPGEEFPTGHRQPPAHPGCRCLLVPSAT